LHRLAVRDNCVNRQQSARALDGTSHTVFHPQLPEKTSGVQPRDEVARYGYAIGFGGRAQRDINASRQYTWH
jgi:hypothetical protein